MLSNIFLDTNVTLINHIIIMQSFYYSILGVGNGGWDQYGQASV